MAYLYIYLAVGLGFSLFAHLTEEREDFTEALATTAQFLAVAVIFPWVLIRSFITYKKRKNKK